MDPKDEYVKRATAHHRGGAGAHKDRRSRRRRSRNDQDRWARWEEDRNNG